MPWGVVSALGVACGDGWSPGVVMRGEGRAWSVGAAGEVAGGSGDEDEGEGCDEHGPFRSGACLFLLLVTGASGGDGRGRGGRGGKCEVCA